MEKIIFDKYDLYTYTRPYWEGDTVYHESVWPIESKDGGALIIPLLYTADEIISVTTSDLKYKYQEGKDYELKEGKLYIPENSSIPKLSLDKYYPPVKENAFNRNESFGDGYIMFYEGAVIHKMQIAVTYKHSDKYEGYFPQYKGDLLPITASKITSNGKFKILLFGDSISCGCNSTKLVNAEPFAETWFNMFFDTLRQNNPNLDLQTINISVGGQTSAWGKDVVDEKVTDNNIDLCIIGFGMNDGSGMLSPESYIGNIKYIMNSVKDKSPDCEFVLISTMLPNKEVGRFFGNQELYLPELLKLEKEGIAVLDMTSLHKSLLEKKRYVDMTANNVNHPNDFLARAYAQNFIKTIIK